MLPLLCVAALAGCDSNTSNLALNGSITSSLKPGMTEQQMAEVSNRGPDSVVMRTCGTETPMPFPCKVYVYDGALRAGTTRRFRSFGGCRGTVDSNPVSLKACCCGTCGRP
jgi:hypothetical protein